MSSTQSITSVGSATLESVELAIPIVDGEAPVIETQSAFSANRNNTHANNNFSFRSHIHATNNNTITPANTNANNNANIDNMNGNKDLLRLRVARNRQWMRTSLLQTQTNPNLAQNNGSKYAAYWTLQQPQSSERSKSSRSVKSAAQTRDARKMLQTASPKANISLKQSSNRDERENIKVDSESDQRQTIPANLQVSSINRPLRIINGPSSFQTRSKPAIQSYQPVSVGEKSKSKQELRRKKTLSSPKVIAAIKTPIQSQNTHKTKQTQHPPEFVVRHVNNVEIYPVELVKPKIGVPPPVASPLKPISASSSVRLSNKKPSPKNRIRKLSENNQSSPKHKDPHVQSQLHKFELQKSDVLRYIQRLKSQYARHISSPYRRTARPNSPMKFKETKNVSSASLQRVSPTSLHRISKSRESSPHRSVRPPSPLSRRRSSPSGSHIPIKSPISRRSLRNISKNRKDVEQDVDWEQPFVAPLIKDVKRAFPPLEPDENPRRKRFKEELEKAWEKNLEEGLADY
ncbi:hypothetical protein HK100_010770 [Physocladia obscura]|uniref:Uncharacterized protein n=1 Tax=Physocladia obscura TaxID=109957 RepID=A0AAD5T2Q7_9FUNG|nr:hypothetical protein HK100_010770 [Physocladia obscura]